MDYLFSLHKLITFAAEKKEERQKDRVDQDFVVYRIDEKGNYSPEDLVMMQAFTSYYNTKKKCNTYIMFQLFTTDRAYVTKDELKQMKKDNKMKLTRTSRSLSATTRFLLSRLSSRSAFRR